MINRRVAFKILLPNLALNNERLVALFQREAEMAGQLSHENIVDIKDAGRTPEGLAYIVMEWLDGHTLDDELAQEKQLSFQRTAVILRQVAAALDHAHSRNIIHRDLKPSNIMIVSRPDGGEQVKVVDFGIAKVASESTASPVSRLIGTPHYASPEQFMLGSLIDGRSDIYSLGVMLYQMLSGTLPFLAPTPQELIKLRKTEAPPHIREHRGDVPEAIDQLLERMLAREPENRPQSAGEAVKLFDRAIDPAGDRLATARANAMPTVIGSSADTNEGVDIDELVAGSSDTVDARSSSRTVPYGAETTPHPPSPAARDAQEKDALAEAPVDQSVVHADGKLKKYGAVAALALALAVAGLFLYPRFIQPLLSDGSASTTGGAPEPVRTELMNYYLDISSDRCNTLTRGAGDESLRAGQAFRFHFRPSENGYLYIIAQNEKNVPMTFLTAQPDADTSVKSNFVAAGSDYSFPSGDGNCIGISGDERMMAFTVIFSPSLLATPAFLTAPAMRELNATEQNELRQWRRQHESSAPQITPDAMQQLSRVTALRSPDDAGRPVIFDLPIKRR
jgi:serine/threonine protein kinase